MYIRYKQQTMVVKKLILTTLIGTVAYYAVGWFVFEFMLGNYTNLHTTQLAGFKKTAEQFGLVPMVLSCGTYAALLSFILVYLLNCKELVKAAMIGCVVGVLVAIMADSFWYATSNFYLNSTVVLFDILAAGVTVGFMGLVIALSNKKLS